MSKCSLDIKKDIIDDAGKRLTSLKATVEGNVGFFANPNRASAAIDQVNRHFGDLVVKEGEKGSFMIDPSDALVDYYFEEYKRTNIDTDELGPDFEFRPQGFYMGDQALEEQERKNLFFQTNKGVKFTNEMRDKLLSFLKGLDISVQFNADEILQSREFQRNPLAAFDVLQKFMAFASGQEKLLPRQVAAAAYTFLGRKSTLSKALWKHIKMWDGYQKTYDQYNINQQKNYDQDIEYMDDEYMDDEQFNPFAHRMAIIRFLEESMMKVASGETATQKKLNEDVDVDYFIKRGRLNVYEKDISELQRVFRRIYNWLQDIFGKPIFEKYNREDLTQLGLDIAEDIFKNDYSKYLRGIVERDGELYTSAGDKLELKDYDKTLAGDPVANEMIMDLVNDPFIRFKLSGSLTLRKYGEVFRDVKEDLHDIDGVISLDVFRQDPLALPFVQWIQRRGLPLLGQKKVKTFAREAKPLIEKLNWYVNVKRILPEFQITNVFIGRDHKKGESVTIQGKVVRNGKEYKFDFFLRTDEGNYPEIFDNYWKDWKQIFEAKLNMGRSKDIFDLVYFDPFIKDKFKFTNKGFRYFAFEEDKLQEQLETMPASRSSAESIAKIKDAAKKMGIDIQALSDYAKAHPEMDVTTINGLADLLKGVVAVAEGKEDVALTEEIVHIATAILEQTNPKLFTEMISKIGRFKIYNQTLEAYKKDKNYQLPNGKPDIRKIKKEAMDKLIVEVMINKNEGSTEFPELMEQENFSLIERIWNAIRDWISGVYRKADINIFEQAAAQIMTGELGAAYGRVKPGVQELFDSNPELASIGTPEQYSAYLDSIFPDSKMKDIVYHGKNQGQSLDIIPNTDTYFAPTKEEAVMWGRRPGKVGYLELFIGEEQVKDLIESTDIDSLTLYFDGKVVKSDQKKLWKSLYDVKVTPAILNNPYIGETELEKIKNLKEYSGRPEQIHILGNEQDLEGFRNFVASAPATFRGEGLFLQKNTAEQQRLVDELERTKDFIEKKTSDNAKVDPILMDTEEGSNFYENTKPDGTKKTVLNRVTDRVKAWYAERFPNKQFTEGEKIFNELKRKFGIEGHKDFEEIHGRYYNSDGTKKSKPDPRPRKFNLPSEQMYSKLEKYYVDLIKTFPKDTLILSEVVVYDPSEDEAGTLDFVAIEPSGKTHILDWKFMYIAADKDDVAWFKQGAYNIQLGRYKEILKKVYGVKEFGMTRAIPFLMNFKPKNKFDITKGWTLGGISAGSANPADIEDLRLIPIAEETESTGEKEVDNLIVKLNALLKQIESEKPTESEKQFKIERLNTLRQTIRVIQATGNIAPLIDTIEVMRKEGERILNDYNAIYKDRPAKSTDSKDKELSDFSDDMNNYLTLSDVFANIANDIGDLIYNEDMVAQAKTKAQKEELKLKREALSKLTYESREIYRSRKAIKDVSEKFADKHIGQRNTVVGLLRPEAIVKGLSSLFRGVADLPLASLNILYKVVRNAQGRADADAFEEAQKIMAIRKKIVAKGVNVRNYIKQIYQKDDDGGFVNKLIHKFSKEFKDTVDDKATAGGDRQWLLQNIDLEGYKKEAKTVIERRLEQIKKQSFSGSETEVKAKRRKAAEDMLREFDISRKDFNGYNNFIIKRHPLPKWYSEEYKAIEKDADLLELYNFIVEFNEKAKDVGYIDNQISKTFLPFIRKTMAESLSWDNSLSAIAKWNDTLKTRIDDVGYGNINQINGKVENSIPKYYTYDFTRNEDGVNDYSEVSEDLFKNLILYVQQVNKYKYMTEVEGQLKLVKTIEEFKQHHLRTNRNGDVVIKEGSTEPETERGNEANAKMYDDFLRTLLYDQKYILSDSDIPLGIGKVVNFMKGAINTVAGKEILKPSEDATPTSLLKLMDATNRAFQIKTLGADVIPGAVNWFGSNLQIAAQIRDYFDFSEFFKNQGKLLNMEFKNDEEAQMYIDLFNTFMPLKDDPSYQLYNEAGLTTLTKRNFGDMIMFFMRYPETLVEKATFISLLQNTMVNEDGRIVSIKEYVKKKYKNRNASSTSYRETKDLIDKEVEELKKTKSLDVTKKLENGKLVIPGFDLTNREEIQRLTNLSRQISQNATGSMSKQNINRMSMSIWTKSMMVFKGWIPKLADTRFSELRKISDDFSTEVKYDKEGNAYIEGQKYEIGRVRLLGYVMMTSMRDRASNITNILKMNDAGVVALDKLYEEFARSYKARTGEDFNMSKDDFIDMVRTNLANQLQELAWLAGLIAASIALGYMAPDDEDDKAAKNAYRYAQKVLDKFVSELSFFYNPLEIESILSGNIFPAIGMINDILKFLQHFFLEITGFDFDPNTSYDDVRKKAQPIKYMAKAAPVTKVALTYGAIFSSDFAKEFDITVQKEARR